MEQLMGVFVGLYQSLKNSVTAHALALAGFLNSAAMPAPVAIGTGALAITAATAKKAEAVEGKDILAALKPYSFVDQGGKKYDPAKELKGKMFLMAYGFEKCEELCAPNLVPNQALLMNKALPIGTKLVIINTRPDSDMANYVKLYQKAGVDPAKLVILTPNVKATEIVKTAKAIQTACGELPGSGDFTHSTVANLVDKDGKSVKSLSLVTLVEDEKNDFKAKAGGRGK